MARNYNDVVSAMDSFLHKIAAEKDSAGIQKQAEKAEGTSPAGSAPSPKLAKSQGDSDKGDGSSQGAPGTEKKDDINKETSAGVPIAKAAPNGDGKSAPKDGSDKTFNVLDSEDSVPGIATHEIKQGELYKEVTASQKYARAERLGSAILEQIVALSGVQKEAEYIEKTAEEQHMEKLAAEAFDDFTRGYARGVEKKVEDVCELLESGICKTAEEAEAILDQVPPEAKLPEEAIPGEEADAQAAISQMPPEQAQVLDQLAQQMAGAGVTPEDIEAAAQQMEELTEAGVSPEEIIQATQELAQEGGAEGGEGESQAPGESAGPSPEDQQKMAAERHDAIKNYIRGLSNA